MYFLRHILTHTHTNKHTAITLLPFVSSGVEEAAPPPGRRWDSGEEGVHGDDPTLTECQYKAIYKHMKNRPSITGNFSAPLAPRGVTRSAERRCGLQAGKGSGGERAE